MDAVDISKIEAAMKTAFGSLEYSVELDDYGEKLKVEVLLKKGKPVTLSAPIGLVTDTNNLDTFIRTCRDAVEAAQGRELPPWVAWSRTRFSAHRRRRRPYAHPPHHPAIRPHRAAWLAPALVC